MNEYTNLARSVCMSNLVDDLRSKINFGFHIVRDEN